jgi:hypothetical protein
MAVGFSRCDHEEVREGDEGRTTRSTELHDQKLGMRCAPDMARTYFGCAREHRPRDLGIPALTFAAGAEPPH